MISITHLPQIAARGRAHYKVYKKDSDTETNSHIRRLTDEERVEEIAHMLSGATLTEAAQQCEGPVGPYFIIHNSKFIIQNYNDR